MRLLGICLELGLERGELGKRRIGVGLLLALPALAATILVAAMLLVAMLSPTVIAVTVIAIATLLPAALLPAMLLIGRFLAAPLLIAPLLIAPVLAIPAEGRPLAAAPLSARFGSPLTLIPVALALSKLAGRAAPMPALVGLRLLCARRLAIRGGGCALDRGLCPIAVLTVGGTTRTAALLAAAARPPDLNKLRLGRGGGSLSRPIGGRSLRRRCLDRSRRRLCFRRLCFRFGSGTAR
jgi:hypothetical protein